MSIEKISGIIALLAHAVAAAGWLYLALKQRRRVEYFLAAGFLLLWVPIAVRLFGGDVFSVTGKRVITGAYLISRVCYVGAYVCFATSAVVGCMRCTSKSVRPSTSSGNLPGEK